MGQQCESVVTGVKELIKQLEEIKTAFHEIAVDLRETNQKVSYESFQVSEVSGKAIDELRRNIPEEMEMEGGGTSWWYVCPECHGAIDNSDHYCRHCGQAVK